MVQAIRRVSTVPQDAWGRLQVSRGDGMVTVGGRPVPASCWDRLVDAGVLAPSNAGTGLFIFVERALMHHALLLAARDLAVSDSGEPPPGTGERSVHALSQT